MLVRVVLEGLERRGQEKSFAGRMDWRFRWIWLLLLLLNRPRSRRGRPGTGGEVGMLRRFLGDRRAQELAFKAFK
jgi:hypothetical protein